MWDGRFTLEDRKHAYGSLLNTLFLVVPVISTTFASVWLGCPLVVHRRCIEPIFSMSNDIAYSGRMFCKTVPPSADKRFLFEQSVWFDAPGAEIGGKNHTVTAQIDPAARLMKTAGPSIPFRGKKPMRFCWCWAVTGGKGWGPRVG
jgi:hypothetical protein